MPKQSKLVSATPQLISLGAAPPEPAYQIFTDTIEVQRHRVYLSDELGSPADYIELIDELRSASSHDEFTLFLNSSGGRVDAGLQLINAMRASAATVTTVLDPYAYSMAAFIFLASDFQVVPENAQLMLHNYSSGLLGKGNEQLAEVRAASHSFQNLFKSICHPFLNMDEIISIMNGQDLWLDADNIRKRFKRMEVGGESGTVREAKGSAPRKARAKASAPDSQAPAK